MNIHEHYTINDSQHTLNIELASPYVSFASPLADLVVQAGILKRNFVQTQSGLRMQYLDDETKRDVFAFLSNVSITQLEEQAEKRRQHEEQQAEKQRQRDEERQHILSLAPNEFGKLLSSASQGKLKFVAVASGSLRISPSQLLPLTHFKKFARLGAWLGKEEQFAYAIPLSTSVRGRLLDAATALSRSRKKITKNDIDVRRKSRLEREELRTGVIDADFCEAAEDFGTEQARIWLAQGRLRDLDRDN